MESRAAYQRQYRRNRLLVEPGWDSKLHTHKRERARNAINKMKELGCSKCGYNKCNAALHFHHPKGTKKNYLTIVGKLVSQGRMSAAVNEAKKCELICANCHAELHNE